MADFSALKAAIQAAIRQNGNNEITGNIMQGILLSMVNTLGDAAINSLIEAFNQLSSRVADGYMYVGLATPSSSPSQANGKVFYIALQDGVYTNYGGWLVHAGINILSYDTNSWNLETLCLFDNRPQENSDGFVRSGGIYGWLKSLKNIYLQEQEPIRVSQGKYIDSSDGLEHSASDYCTIYFEREQLDEYFLLMKLLLNGISIPLFAFYDSNMNYLGFVRPYNTGFVEVIDELYVIDSIPSSCKYIGTTSYGSSDFYNGYMKVVTVKGALSVIGSRIEQLYNNNMLIAFPLEEKLGYYDISDNTFRDNDAYLTKIYDVRLLRDRIIKANAYIAGSSIEECVYLDGNKNYISHQSTAPSGDIKDYEMTPVIPSNAAYLLITGISYETPERTRIECYAYTENKLKNQIIMFDGDSICAALNFTQGGWAKRIGVKNLMDWHNDAVSGGVIVATDYVGSTLGRDRHSVSANIDVIHQNYTHLDYLIFEGGTNDADQNKFGNIQTGEYKENEFRLSQFDDKTFYGALDTLFYKALMYYPKAKIGFIIAQKMGFSNTEYVQHRREYFDIIIKECKKWGIPYIDLWYHGQLRPDVDSMAQEYPSRTPEEAEALGLAYYDGQHLTNIGYDVITPKIESWLKSL